MNARRVAAVGISTLLACAAVVGVGSMGTGAVAPNLTGTWTATGLPAATGVPFASAYDSTHGQLFAGFTDLSGPAVFSVQHGVLMRFLQGGTWHPAPDPFPPASVDTFGLVDAPALGGVVATQGPCASRWNGTSWSALSCAPSLAQINNQVAAAYDGTRGTLLLVVDEYDGDCCSTFYDDTVTWSWNGQTWQRLAPATEPVPDMGPTVQCDEFDCTEVVFEPAEVGNSAAAWDASLHRVVLVRGGTRTWTWDGSNWAKPALPISTASTAVSLAYDARLATVLLYGAPFHTAEWNGSEWRPVVTTGLQPPSGVLCDDPALGGVVLMANPVAVRLPQPAPLWRFTPGIDPPVL